MEICSECKAECHEDEMLPDADGEVWCEACREKPGCFFCNGEGTITLECPSCGGSGEGQGDPCRSKCMSCGGRSYDLVACPECGV